MSGEYHRHGAPLYDPGTRAIVWERGRLAVGEVIAIDETPREPLYGIRFSAERRLMFRAGEVVAHTPARYDALSAVMAIVFAGFRAEDEQ
jgi:hypothetical protein